MSLATVRVQSPTRLDLAGGTLDLWPISAFFAPVPTINMAISIWTRAEIEPLPGGQVELRIQDLGIHASYKNLSECLSDPRKDLNLIKTLLRYFEPSEGFRLTTESESPVGGGLGGSSSLTISLIKAFSLWQRIQMGTPAEVVHLAHNLEAQVLGVPTGTQDYYPALVGGLNVIEYGLDQTKLRSLAIHETSLEKQFLLVYTGRPHQSGLNNWKVLRECIDGEPRTLEALGALKEVAWSVEKICSEGRWSDLPQSLNLEYEARVRLSPVFSSPEIERLKIVALQAGASAVKICGAGGGGCVMIWCPPDARQKVAQACSEARFQVLERVHPVPTVAASVRDL